MKKALNWFTSLVLLAIAPGMIRSAEAATSKRQAGAEPVQLSTIQTDKQDPFATHALGCSCAACQQARKTVDSSTV